MFKYRVTYEELYDLYSTPNIMWNQIKNETGGARPSMEESGRGEVLIGFWWGNLRESSYKQ
jgi:hypothetical protein